MNQTKLLYMEDMWTTEGNAIVQAVVTLDEKTIVILDQTWFYAQGGGQPYDQGTIESPNGSFRVEEVRFMDGIVKHSGHFQSGSFQVGETVELKIDPVRRALMSRNHSSGHLIDMALKRLNVNWKPAKGYHFPEGPYVEYEGELPQEDLETFRMDLEDTCQALIAENTTTRIEFLSAQEMQKQGHKIPELAPEKPLRLVYYGDFAIPCGGTHVKNLKEIGHLKIRKIKQDKDHIRVAYACA